MTEGIGWPAAMDAPISPQNVDGVGRTLAEWQDTIRSYATERSGAPEHLIDGSGTDSGDPLDLTLAEVSQAIGYVEDRAEEAERQRDRAIVCEEGLSDQVADLQATVARLEGERDRALGEGAGLREALEYAASYLDASLDTYRHRGGSVPVIEPEGARRILRQHQEALASSPLSKLAGEVLEAACGVAGDPGDSKTRPMCATQAGGRLMDAVDALRAELAQEGEDHD